MGILKDSGIYKGPGIYKTGAEGGGGGSDYVEIDGRRYPTVKIGPLIWTTENLDWKLPGIEIGNTSPSSAYARACYYDNDEATHGVNGDKWGLLYNTKAVQAIEQSGLLPEGFRIPTENDFNGIITLPSSYLTKDGTNYFGFDVLRSGGLFGGSFVDGEKCAYMWCQTNAYYFSIETSGYTSGKTDSKHGMSLRLCKDA